MARRQFGSIRRLTSGRYQVRYKWNGAVLLGPETFATKADASAWLANTQTDLLRGAWVDPAAGKVTLAEYANSWLANRSDLRPTTRAKYEGLLRRHILPSLGETELAKLKPADVRAWYHGLARDHQATASDAYRALRAILNTAVVDGDLAKLPCMVRGAGSVKAAERPVASVAEVTAAVQEAPEQYRLAFLLASWCQLRRGEILGLQRSDVDLLHQTIQVKRARVVTAGGVTLTGPPKTAAGVRTLTMPRHILPALEQHLERFVRAHPSAWLFAEEDGTPMLARKLNWAWVRARRAIARPDLHLHDLRHSGLTWSAATGASVAELMRRGGHSSPVAALRYQHATEDQDKALADALADLTTANVVPIKRPGERLDAATS
jgi:integrase